MNHVQLAVRAVPHLKQKFGDNLIYRCVNRGDNHLSVYVQDTIDSEPVRAIDVRKEGKWFTFDIYNCVTKRSHTEQWGL